MMKTAFVATVFGLMSNVNGADFDYGQNGADWTGIGDCGLDEQSPINVDTETLVYKSDIELDFFYDVVDSKVSVMNTGKTIQVNVNGRGGPKKTAVFENNIYVVEQLHFHWDSENTVNGQQFPLEVHIVHYNEADYADLGEALGQENGVLVVGVLFELVVTARGYEPPFPTSFDDLVRTMNDSNDKTAYLDELLPPTFNLNDLLPSSPEEFVRFRGSLTTPDCTEKVSWVLMKNVLPIYEWQVETFDMMEIFGTGYASNFREVQPLNGRTVYCSWEGCGAEEVDEDEEVVDEVDEDEEVDDSAAYHSSPAGLVAFLSMAVAFFSW